MSNFEEELKDAIVGGIKKHADANNRVRVHELVSNFRKNGTDYREFDEIQKGLYAKEHFLKDVLSKYKQGNPEYAIQHIKLARDNGYDYPEFHAIEKSIAAAKDKNNRT